VRQFACLIRTKSEIFAAFLDLYAEEDISIAEDTILVRFFEQGLSSAISFLPGFLSVFFDTSGIL
jgi:hypothetical protein